MDVIYSENIAAQCGLVTNLPATGPVSHRNVYPDITWTLRLILMGEQHNISRENSPEVFHTTFMQRESRFFSYQYLYGGTANLKQYQTTFIRIIFLYTEPRYTIDIRKNFFLYSSLIMQKRYYTIGTTHTYSTRQQYMPTHILIHNIIRLKKTTSMQSDSIPFSL